MSIKVVRRWATRMTVRSLRAAVMACWTNRSLMLSRADVPFVEDQDRRILEEDPRQCDPLPLTAGEVLASLRDSSLVTPGIIMISS